MKTKSKLSETLIVSKNLFRQLRANLLSELGRQPDRLRVIYSKDMDFIEYDIKLSLLDKEQVIIRIR